MTNRYLLIYILALAGCQGTYQTLTIDQEHTWSRQEQRRSEIKTWTIDCKMSVLDKNTNKHVSLIIKWNRQHSFEEITVSDPIGLNTIIFSNSSHQAQARTTDRHVLAKGRSIEELIKLVVGHDLPIQKLVDVIRGIPLKTDTYTVTYSRYTTHENGLILPTLFSIESFDHKMKIRIRDWQL